MRTVTPIKSACKRCLTPRIWSLISRVARVFETLSPNRWKIVTTMPIRMSVTAMATRTSIKVKAERGRRNAEWGDAQIPLPSREGLGEGRWELRSKNW